MKKIILNLFLVFLTVCAYAQNGLENIIVEKYYVSNANDTTVNGVGGVLPIGSVTYRIYADMLPGYKFQVAYGLPGHELRLATSTTFFNNEDRGSTAPTYTKTHARDNTVMLDSWLSAGAGCAGNFGILKSDDNGVATVVNLDGVLQNNDPAAGIPLTSQDGLIAGTPEDLTTIGIASEIAIFNNVNAVGNLFSTTNGSWASLNGSTGPDGNNRVLIAQMTTNGCFTFELNIQIGTPSGGVQNYVARNPVGSEIVIPSLIYNAAGISIAASPTGPICAGTNVTFTATPVNGGTTPSYQWKKNGINVGANSSSYSDSTLVNGDQLLCVLTSNDTCATGSPATSNTIIMNVSPVSVASVSIIANPVSPICAGTSVTFTATPVNGGTTPSYQWKKNGSNVGTNSPTYIDAGLTNGNTINCVMTSSDVCATGSPATSNTINMTVNPNVTASVSISKFPTGINCSGANVTFTAVPTNGGTTPVYQWQKNGLNVGTNSSTYATTSLVDGDQVVCILTSNAPCVSGSPATSNTISVTVTSSPSISSFTPSTGSAGTLVTINGSGFTGTTSVRFNGITAAFSVVNSGQITATVPAAATTGVIIVANTCGSTSSGTSFIIPVLQGLENVIVEKYYISNANDTSVNIDGGSLPIGSVTYRIYADMLPGYKFQAAYGVAGHELRLATSTLFFNNEDRGATTPTYTKTQAADNTVMLDSWLSAGAGCAGNFGVLKSSDNGVATVVNNDGVLQNNDPLAGIPLTVQDGLLTGAIEDVSLIGIASEVAVFGVTNGVGNLFSTSNGSWASLNGSTGPDTANRVLIAQITTDGCFSYELNLQIGTPSGGTQNYVAKNATGGEIQLATLTYPVVGSNVADVNIAANPPGAICAGTSVTFTATPTNGGTSPSYQWKKNGANVGTNSPTYIDAGLTNGNTISCIMTSSDLCVTGSPDTSNIITMTVNPNVTASVSISKFPTGVNCSGANVTFTATPTNGGAAPSYQWKKNGIDVGTNSSTYATTSLVTGDQVMCVLTSNAPCVSGSPANSNTITVTTTTVPSISSFTPSSGAAGTLVTINGSGFASATSVRFNGVTAAFSVVNDGQLTATVPASATTGLITVANNCGSATSASAFTVPVVQGLQDVIVEKYYVSNANDTAVNADGGNLPIGSVTYRIYADMLPGYKFQAAYGVPGHELRLATSTLFFNNEDRGATTPTYTKAQAADNTVMLDSWLSAGGACAGNLGILKANDNGVANVVNNDGVLQNNDPAAGIPLTVQDGLIAGAVEDVTTIGIASEIAVFGATNGVGNLFSTFNGSWASLNGSVGPDTSNRVLIAQITTDGCFSFALNLQIGTPSGGIQNYVASNATGGEYQLASLTYPVTGSNIASVSIVADTTGICAGTNVTFTATPVNGGLSPVFQWKKNGVNVGINSATYSDSTLVNGDQIFVILTSSDFCVSNNPDTSNVITVVVNNCAVAVNLTGFIQGYYVGGLTMNSPLYNSGVGIDPLDADSIRVELRDVADPTAVIASVSTVLHADGTALVPYPGFVAGGTYYLAVFHQNAVQTWTANPITISSSGATVYDFSIGASQAYGDNMTEVEPGVWAFYTGDINQDEFIDVFDFPQYDSDNLNLVTGYVNTDLNGDGFVDVFDFPVYDANNLNLVGSVHP